MGGWLLFDVPPSLQHPAGHMTENHKDPSFSMGYTTIQGIAGLENYILSQFCRRLQGEIKFSSKPIGLDQN
jgi:hypothetical protein